MNQLPAVDQQKKASVFWVGLSAVAFNDEDEKIPLSPSTRSGALVAEIENPFHSSLSFYKTNVVKCLPLKKDKIRYPAQHEMEKCYPNLEAETKQLKPKVVFLLGKQVATFVLSKLNLTEYELDENFNYEVFLIDGVCYVPIHHPSFVLVYKRKAMDVYISQIRSLIRKKCVRKTVTRSSV
ncbi:uracil-DNA glycosylase family protein [Chryseolinea sp. H1M3-3]|uniref:uracil-DNA glycosylase family protein n=1 Tax=Chryseolinea sp. H1M3-3 TaxID=3034144 RepID=UPI0023EC2731|nr:uracil-DNA glycosylase family protein [Chryseolinea sp. H1M3-3]